MGDDCFLPDAETRITIEDILFNDPLLDLHGEELLLQLRSTLLGAELEIPTTNGTHSYTQLDNGASTPTFLPIWQAVQRTLQTTAKVQAELVTSVQKICADFLPCPHV